MRHLRGCKSMGGKGGTAVLPGGTAVPPPPKHTHQSREVCDQYQAQLSSGSKEKQEPEDWEAQNEAEDWHYAMSDLQLP